MKINFLTATMDGGGTERVIAILANYCANLGYEVEIVTTANSIVAYDLDTKIEVTHLTGETKGRIIKRVKRVLLLRKHFRKNKGATYFSFGTETNLFAIVAKFALNRKLVVSERNDPNKCDFPLMRDAFYMFVKTLVFQTDDAKVYFPKYIQDRGVVIPNPVTENLPDVYRGTRRKTIVSVGRLETQKNHKLLIQAFLEFVKEYKDYELILYGKGYLETQLKEQVKECGIGKNVIFEGFKENVLDEIKDAGIYVLSSNYEGISNSLLEALALGIPAISTDCPIGGSRMLIEDGVNGVLVPMGNAMSMVEAMKQIARDADYANRLSCEAIKVREMYAAEKICKKWLELV